MENNIANLPNIERHRDIFKTTPFHHQYEVFELNKDRSTYAYFMEMGTGKTKVLIDTASYLYLHDEISAVIVFAPKSVYRNWIVEFEKHCAVDYAIHYYSSYSTRKHEIAYQSFLRATGKLQVLLVNVEAMSSVNGPRTILPFAQRFHGKVLMAVDESTTIKSITAARTKAIIALGAYARYRRILTGQPVANNPMDLYAQCAFLDKSWLGSSSFTAFKSRYALQQQVIMGQRRFMKVTGYQRLDELQTRLKRFSYRVSKKECLDLPPKVYVKRYVEMADEQKKLYVQMAKLAVLELEAGDVTATSILAKLEKLHQIVCGHVKTDLGQTIRIKNNRVDQLLEVLDEVAGKALIWCAYQEDVRMITAALKDRYGERSTAAYYGNTLPDERETIRASFQIFEHPLRFIVATMATGKYGTTLTQAGTAIYYSNTYNLENRLQSEDRSHRIGSEIHDKITYVDLISENTVDELYIENLANKKNLADQMSDAIESGSWKRWFTLLDVQQ